MKSYLAVSIVALVGLLLGSMPGGLSLEEMRALRGGGNNGVKAHRACKISSTRSAAATSRRIRTPAFTGP